MHGVSHAAVQCRAAMMFSTALLCCIHAFTSWIERIQLYLGMTMLSLGHCCSVEAVYKALCAAWAASSASMRQHLFEKEASAMSLNPEASASMRHQLDLFTRRHIAHLMSQQQVCQDVRAGTCVGRGCSGLQGMHNCVRVRVCSVTGVAGVEHVQAGLCVHASMCT